MSKNELFTLADIIHGLEQNADPKILLSRLKEIIQQLGQAQPEPMAIVVEAELNNRCGYFERSLQIIYDARDQFLDSMPSEIRSELSRVAGQVHSWRPNPEMAAFEVLRSIAEHHISALPDGVLDHRLLIAGQLAYETGRYEDALTMLTPAAASSALNKVDRHKAIVWTVKSLNELNRREEALNRIEALEQEEIASNRLVFLIQIEKLKLFAAIGSGKNNIKDVMKGLSETLPDDKSDFEQIEYVEALLQAGLIESSTEQKALVNSLIFRFSEDRLHARLANALLMKAGILLGKESVQEKRICLQRAAAIIAENQYSGLRAKLLKTAHGDTLSASAGIGGTLLGGNHQPSRYLKFGKIGAGGQGSVREALDLFTGHECVIKEFYGDNDFRLDDITLGELDAGLKASARVDHPSILAARDFFVAENKLNLIIQRGIGKPANPEVICKLDYTRRALICLQTLDLVAAIHKAGLVHGDLKPDNILISIGIGKEPSVEILDFGIARLKGTNDRRIAIIGTAGFIAPEILRRRRTADPASDIYSLGVIFESWFPERSHWKWMLLGWGKNISTPIRAMQRKHPQQRPEISKLIEQFEEFVN